MEPLLPRVPHRAKWNLDNIHVPVMLCLTRNSVYISSQLIPKRQANSGFHTYLLAPSHPNKVDCVAPDNHIFSIFLFVVLHFLSYESFLPSARFTVLCMKTVYFMEC